MKQLSISLILFLVILSCSNDLEEYFISESELTAYQKGLKAYFFEIALGFENGSATLATRKWKEEMKIFVGGNPTPEILDELERVRLELNNLVTDGFSISIVEDSTASNFYAFFGSPQAFAKIFPKSANAVQNNLGTFYVDYENHYINSGRMFIDMSRNKNLTFQKHFTREELTQSLGLGQDSPRFMTSIFQSRPSSTTEFSKLDRDVISLLYHPEMKVGLSTETLNFTINKILVNQ